MKTELTSVVLAAAVWLALLCTEPGSLRAATLTVTSTADSGPGSLRAAIDQGSSGGIVTDQRGVARPFDVASIPNASDGSDIGAYEFYP